MAAIPIRLPIDLDRPLQTDANTVFAESSALLVPMQI